VYVPTGDEAAASPEILHPRVGIAVVVHVAVREAEQDHLAVGVVTVVGPLAEIFSQRRIGGHFANDRDLPDALARTTRTTREDAQALDAGRLDLDIRS
jgi:alpha-D-ribose 1-methylphosphonate 5-triphosphate diphosphatase PhnM